MADTSSRAILHPVLAQWRKREAAAVEVMPRNPSPQFDGARFSRDWFTGIHTWPHFLSSHRTGVQEYLEIGSFEGMSTRYAAEFFPHAHLTCIDTFIGGGATNADMEQLMEGLEGRFRANIEPIRDRVTVMVGSSTKMLAEISDKLESVDVVFIDGAHYYRNVLIDTAISWPLLRPGGLMIWDDYFNAPAHYGRRTVNLAVNQFLDAFEGDYEPMFAGTQVAVRKTRSEPAIF